MSRFIVVACALAIGLAASPAVAAETCPGNPDALGTSRTITVDPAELPRIGTMQYHRSLPLQDHEVAITFDDGPLPPYSTRVLDALKAECVKVTYFIVGSMARAYPDVLRRMYNDGHVIGTHSMRHPFNFATMGRDGVAREVESGIAAVKAAIGDDRAVSPFFRIPGLARSNTVESYLASQSIAVWSADEVADDWHRGITSADIVRLAMSRIEAKDHRGVLLLHDIHPATANAVPLLLKQLKAKGYKIVQAMPTGERPASVPERAAPEPALVSDASGSDVSKANHKHRHAIAHHRAPKSHRDRDLSEKLELKKTNPQTAVNDFSWVFRRQ